MFIVNITKQFIFVKKVVAALPGRDPQPGLAAASFVDAEA